MESLPCDICSFAYILYRAKCNLPFNKPAMELFIMCSEIHFRFFFTLFAKAHRFFSSLLFQKFCFMFLFALSLNRRVTVYSEGFFVVALQLCWLFSLTLSLCIFTIIIIPVCFFHICTHTFFIHISNICISVMFIFL